MILSRLKIEVYFAGFQSNDCKSTKINWPEIWS